jgi:hypothetical protein
MAQDYMEKIKKLLALAESDNENEARDALLKAKQLMAQHKISERDLEIRQEDPPVRKLTGYSCSKRRDPWLVGLASVIGENFCCLSYRSHKQGYQTQDIGFLGFPEDARACTEVFCYAADCIRSWIKEMKKQEKGRLAEEKRLLADSYGYGFVRGIRDAFEEQRQVDETGWALVMTVPQEVRDAASGMKRSTFHTRSQESLYSGTYRKGWKDGKEFDPGTRISEHENCPDGPDME